MKKQDIQLGERKRAELLAAFGRDELHDPISILTSLAISAAVTAGTTALAYLLAPTPAPNVVGGRSGDFQITRSEQGLFIPEIYGGDPGDGLGGTKIGAIVPWTSGLRRHVSTTGGGGKGGGGLPPPTQTITYDLDLALMWANNGPYQLRKIFANAETILNADFSSPFVYEAELATLTGAATVLRDVNASRSRAVTLTAATGKATFAFERANNNATAPIIFYYRSAASASVTVITNGVSEAVTWPSTDSVYVGLDYVVGVEIGENTTSVQVTAGGPVVLDYLFAEAGFIEPDGNGGRYVTGRRADVGSDDAYTQNEMPNPATEYTLTRERYNGDWLFDAASGGTFAATLTQSVQMVFYPGNDAQLVDPTIEAEVDGRLGAGYTPAYRKRAYSVLKEFFLTAYGGVLPTFTGILEHATFRTLADIAQQWCVRANLVAADSDFTGLDTVDVRGLRILQGPYAPNAVLEQAGEIYDCYFTEQFGQIVGKLRSDEVVASLTDADVGWVAAGDGESSRSLSGVDAKYTPANELPRRVTVRHIDAAKDFEFNTQTEARQIVQGTAEKTLEGEWTLTPDEARAVAARQLYRAYIERVAYTFTLGTKFAWLNAGDLIEIATEDGFTYTLRLTSVRGGIGLIECEALPHDEAVFVQPAVGQGGIFEPPPVPVAAATVGVFLDVPLLREGDATTANGVGVYIAAMPLTGIRQNWPGFGLYRYRNGAWEQIASGNHAATLGRAVTALDDWPYSSGIDDVSSLDVDLYGVEATLQSVTEAEMLNGANMAVIGGEVLHFRTATRQEGYPNRWRLRDFVRGARGSEYAKDDHEADERFVFVNEAVRFVPLESSELQIEADYKFVTAGQDLDDAATLEFTWTGGTAKPLGPAVAAVWQTSPADCLITLTPRERVGGVSYAPNFATPETPEHRLFLEISDATPVRTQLLTSRREVPAVLVADPLDPDNADARIFVNAVSADNSSIFSIVNSGGSATVLLGLRSYNSPSPSSLAQCYIVVSDGGGDTSADAFEWDGATFAVRGSKTFTGSTAADIYLRITIQDGLPQFYADLVGEISLPFAVGLVDARSFTLLTPYLSTTSGGTFFTPRVTSGRYQFSYSAEMRTADGLGSVGVNELAVETWEESPLVGEGWHNEATV